MKSLNWFTNTLLPGKCLGYQLNLIENLFQQLSKAKFSENHSSYSYARNNLRSVLPTNVNRSEISKWLEI